MCKKVNEKKLYTKLYTITTFFYYIYLNFTQKLCLNCIHLFKPFKQLEVGN